MKSMNLLKSAAIGLALSALGVAGAAAAEFEFKMHHLLSGKSPAHTKMLTPWAEQVAKNSGRPALGCYYGCVMYLAIKLLNTGNPLLQKF